MNPSSALLPSFLALITSDRAFLIADALLLSFTLLLLLLLDGVPGGFLQLSETHLGALRVLFEDSLVGFLPL